MHAITLPPTITKTPAHIRSAILIHTERTQRARLAMTVLGGPIDHTHHLTIVRSDTKIKALEFVLADMARDVPSAPDHVMAARDRWRKIARKLEREIRAFNTAGNHTIHIQLVEARAYVMAFSWALGTFDRHNRPFP